jgi:hypothetical protein
MIFTDELINLMIINCIFRYSGMMHAVKAKYFDDCSRSYQPLRLYSVQFIQQAMSRGLIANLRFQTRHPV